MKRRRYITATELAECCTCEQRVVFDRQRGRRRTAESRALMHAGVAMHSALHRAAMRDLAGEQGFAMPPVRGRLMSGLCRLREAITEWLHAAVRWLGA